MNQKGFINIVIIILVITIAGTIGYFALVRKQTPQNIGDCNLVSNSSFRSINQYEVGLGPNGPVMGYWGIQFQKGTTLSDYDQPTFQWGHSDISEGGTYTCKDNVLQVKFFDRSITAHYDGGRKILTWDGVEYKRVE